MSVGWFKVIFDCMQACASAGSRCVTGQQEEEEQRGSGVVDQVLISKGPKLWRGKKVWDQCARAPGKTQAEGKT